MIKDICSYCERPMINHVVSQGPRGLAVAGLLQPDGDGGHSKFVECRKAYMDEKYKPKLNCLECSSVCGEDFYVHDAVWAAAGLKPKDGRIHLTCLEKRLGRAIRVTDFPEDQPVNRGILFAFEMGTRSPTPESGVKIGVDEDSATRRLRDTPIPPARPGL